MLFGLERCPDYEIGYGWYPVYDMGLWMAWKGTSCTEWDCGWIGKVLEVQFGSWSVPGVWIGNVDGLERYLIYIMGLRMVSKGAQSTVWLMIVSVIEPRV
jgi:hypothetical protein